MEVGRAERRLRRKQSGRKGRRRKEIIHKLEYQERSSIENETEFIVHRGESGRKR